tara:strand:+ start:506 stop:1051 length:546 start_codon:yes stop_codon:yes gene_type:complete
MERKFQIIFYFTVLFAMIAESRGVYDFSKNADMRKWQVVDDVVMGGRSAGYLSLDENGNGRFFGYVSLENYGGFSSIRLRHKDEKIDEYKFIVIRILGDNKWYQLRVRSRYSDRHVYVKKFFAKDEWQEIEIPLRSMQPQFRGRKLRMKNFNANSIVEYGILVGNKVEEDFNLLIDYISLR